MNDCQGCAKYTRGSCSDGHRPDHCPRDAFVPDEPHHTIRSCGTSAHQLEQADYEEQQP